MVHSFDDALNTTSGYQFSIGENESRNIVFADLQKISHLLVSGATGTGKSVFLNSMLLTLIYHNEPDALRLLLFDSKIVEFSPYNGIPHLLIPVITMPQMLASALKTVEHEMEYRLQKFAESGNRSLSGYNDYLWENFVSDNGLPRILVVIDDLSVAISTVKSVENSIQQIMLKGRTVGIHLVAAVQAPTSKYSKQISTSFRSKILFSAATAAESKLLLGTKGAESLGPCGEALFSLDGASSEKVCSFMPSSRNFDLILESRKKECDPAYDKDIINKIEQNVVEKEKDGDKRATDSFLSDEMPDVNDDLLPAAIEIVLETGQASVSMLQRRLKSGYSRAARIVDEMEDLGIVGPFDGSTPRKLLITKDDWLKMKMRGQEPIEFVSKETALEKTTYMQNYDDGEVQPQEIAPPAYDTKPSLPLRILKSIFR